MGALRWYTENKIRGRLIIDRFHERQEMSSKAEVLLALFENVQFQKTRRVTAYEKLEFLGERRMQEPIMLWRQFVVESRKQELAERYF